MLSLCSHPATKPVVLAKPSHPFFGSGAIEVTHGRHDLADLPTCNGILRIDFQDFEILPHRLAELALSQLVLSTGDAGIEVLDVFFQES